MATKVTREKILEAALELFRERGFAEATMRDDRRTGRRRHRPRLLLLRVQGRHRPGVLPAGEGRPRRPSSRRRTRYRNAGGHGCRRIVEAKFKYFDAEPPLPRRADVARRGSRRARSRRSASRRARSASSTSRSSSARSRETQHVGAEGSGARTSRRSSGCTRWACCSSGSTTGPQGQARSRELLESQPQGRRRRCSSSRTCR